MTSLYIYNSEVTPNPSTSQLFMIPNNEKFTLDFQSNSDKMVMVNLRGIGGKAEIHWASDEDNKYYLKGRDDRLSITSKNIVDNSANFSFTNSKSSGSEILSSSSAIIFL